MLKKFYSFSIFAALAAAVVLSVSACGGRSGNALEQGARGNAALSPPKILSALMPFGRTTSGLPVGIRLTWTRVAEPTAAGYFLYRDTSPIADGREGDVTIRVNDGIAIPQQPGDPITFDDMMFTGGHPIVGETYFYRVTVVDTAGEESFFSNEFSYTVQEQDVTFFTPSSGEYGDTVTITGTFFGTFDESTDEVHFAGSPDTIPAEILNWTNTQISVAVPDFAITGQIFVIIDGTIAATDGEFEVSNPFLTGADKTNAAEGESLVISGSKLGSTQGASTISFGGEESPAQVVLWSDTQISVNVPPINAVQSSSIITVTIGGNALNTLTIAIDPLITAPSAIRASTGNQITITGKHFGTSGQLLVSALEVATDSWSPSEVKATITEDWIEGDVLIVSVNPSNVITYINDTEVFFNFPEGFAGSAYEKGSLYEIEIVTNSNVESVEFLINGAVYRSDDTPANGFKFTLNPDDFTNNVQFLTVRAHRRDESFESEPQPFYTRVFDGDYNGDDKIDLADLDALYAFWFGTVMPSFNNSASLFPTLDGNRDGVIDERDAALIGYLFGQSRP